MDSYHRVAKQLGTVKRAWKRTTALSGLAVTVLESVGIFTVVLLADMLYRPLPPVRIALFVAGVSGVVYLLAKHVLAPLLRRIPDEQAALYVEEHDPRFEGSLMAAAEFRQTQWRSDQQAELVDAIIAEAAARAERIDLRAVLDLSRLRKYGAAAALVVVGYLAIGLLFPKAVGHHAVRVVRPWQATPEDLARVERARLEREPIRIGLSREDTRLLRGTPFELEVALSRASRDPVLLHFRAADQGRWRHLVMMEMDKLNGFEGLLPDVNEDLEFFVTTGEAKSSQHRLTVYDPLVIEGVEVTTHYPEYLKLEDRVQTQSAGDVTAPKGSRVTVRALTNRPVASGALKWEGGAEQALAPDPKREQSAIAAFDVAADASFTFAVSDVDGQQAESPGPSYVRAIDDTPPTLALRYPMTAVTLHPLGEVTFVADASDDFGIAAVELAYVRGLEEDAQETRVPLTLESSDEPGAPARAKLNFRLEDVAPRFKPEDSVAYYLECRDRKGQKAITDIQFLTINHFETWATWDSLPPEEEMPDVRSLEPYFAATWHLHMQKEKLPREAYNRQTEELAESMTDPETGELYTFAHSTDPAKQVHVRRATEYVKKGHDALTKHNTGKAVEAFRVALAEIARLDLAEDQIQDIPQGPTPDTLLASDRRLDVAAIEAARVEAEMKLEAPEAQNADQAKEMQRLAEEADNLEQEQDEVVQGAKKLAKEKQQDEEGELARRQEQVAEKTKQVAERLQQHALENRDAKIRETSRKVDRAATEMQRAARRVRQGEVEKALAEAERARKTLREAADDLGGVQQAKLERALDSMEARIERLLAHQRETREKTQAVARAMRPQTRPTTPQQRDLRVAGGKQARLKTKTETLSKEIRQVRTWAEKTARPETTKHIKEAARRMRQRRVRQKMGNAVVELADLRPRPAAEEQQQAEQGLEQVLASVRAANDSLASDIESELRRAKNEAKRIEQDLDQAKTKSRPEDRERIAYDMRRLAKHLDHRDFVPQREVEQLKQTVQKPRAFADRIRLPEEKLKLLRAVRRLRNRLEEAYEAKLAAKALFAAQREECPPQYRSQVNRYYEALAEAREAGGR